MKKTIIIKFILLSLLAVQWTTGLCAMDYAKSQVAQSSSSIISGLVTASEYATFLNAVAADDPYHLYDEKMGIDPTFACIARVGTPENYEYLVISGKENMPVNFVSWFNAARYCNWLENGEQTGKQCSASLEEGSYTLNGIDDEAGDGIIISKNPNATYSIADGKKVSLSLKSSNNHFIIVTNSNESPLLTMIPGAVGATESSAVTDVLQEAAGAVAIGMMSGGRGVEAEALHTTGENRELTLQDFRNAYKQYPDAPRLILNSDGTIQPREVKTSSTFSFTNPEDKKIIGELRAVFKKEYPNEDVDTFLPGSGKKQLTFRCSPLSGERLRSFFLHFDKKRTSDAAQTVSLQKKITSEELYKIADDFFDKAEEARSTRAALRRDKGYKQKLLNEAQELLKQETDKFEAINIGKTSLGKLSRNAKGIGGVLSNISLAGVSPAAPFQVVGKAAGSLNRRLESAQMKSARQALQKAQENFDQASKALDDHERRDNFDLKALQAEEAARNNEENRALREAQQAGIDAASTWLSRIYASEEYIETLKAQKEEALQPLEEALRIAEQEAIAARTKANAVQNPWDTAEQSIAEAEAARRQAQEEWDALEDQLQQLRSGAETKAQRDNIKDQQKIKETERTYALSAYQTAYANYVAAQQDFGISDKSLEKIALAAEKESLQKFKEYWMADKRLLQAIKRAEDQNNAYRKAFIAVWPQQAIENGITTDKTQEIRDVAKNIETATSEATQQGDLEKVAAATESEAFKASLSHDPFRREKLAMEENEQLQEQYNNACDEQAAQEKDLNAIRREITRLQQRGASQDVIKQAQKECRIKERGVAQAMEKTKEAHMVWKKAKYRAEDDDRIKTAQDKIVQCIARAKEAKEAGDQQTAFRLTGKAEQAHIVAERKVKSLNELVEANQAGYQRLRDDQEAAKNESKENERLANILKQVLRDFIEGETIKKSANKEASNFYEDIRRELADANLVIANQEEIDRLQKDVENAHQIIRQLTTSIGFLGNAQEGIARATQVRIEARLPMVDHQEKEEYLKNSVEALQAKTDQLEKIADKLTKASEAIADENRRERNRAIGGVMQDLDILSQSTDERPIEEVRELLQGLRNDFESVKKTAKKLTTHAKKLADAAEHLTQDNNNNTHLVDPTSPSQPSRTEEKKDHLLFHPVLEAGQLAEASWEDALNHCADWKSWIGINQWENRVENIVSLFQKAYDLREREIMDWKKIETSSSISTQTDQVNKSKALSIAKNQKIQEILGLLQKSAQKWSENPDFDAPSFHEAYSAYKLAFSLIYQAIADKAYLQETKEDQDCFTKMADQAKKASEASAKAALKAHHEEWGQFNYWNSISDAAYATSCNVLYSLHHKQRLREEEERQIAKTMEKPGQVETEWLWLSLKTVDHSADAATLFTQAAEAYDAGQTDKGSALYNRGQARLRAAAQVAKIIEKPEQAEAWERAIALNEESAGLFTQAVEAYDADERYKGVAFYWGARAKLHAAEQVAKTIEKPQEADAWERAIALNEASANYYAQAVEADDAGEICKRCALNNAGTAKLRAAVQVAKTIEKPEQAEAWERAIALNEDAASYSAQAVEACDAGVRDQGNAFYWAGLAKLRAALQVAKTIEKPEQAEACERGIKLNEELAKYFYKAAAAWSRENETDATKWNNGEEVAEKANEQLSDALESHEQAAEASQENRPEEAALWTQAAKLRETAAEYYISEAKAIVEGNETEETKWDSAANAAKNEAEQLSGALKSLKKAAEASQENRREEAALWTQCAKLTETAAEYYISEAKAIVQGNEPEAEKWNSAANASKNGAGQLESAASSLKKAAKASEENRSQEAVLWIRCAELRKTAANAIAQGNETEATKWNKAAEASKNGAEQLSHWNHGAAESLKKAAIASEENRPEESELWTQCAKLTKTAAKYYSLAAKAIADENEADVTKWNKAAEASKNGVEQLSHWNHGAAGSLKKAAEAFKENRPEESELWTQCAELRKNAANYYAQAGEAYDAGQTDKGNALHYAGAAKLRAAAQVAKTIEKPEQAEAWKRAIGFNEASANYSAQAVEAYDAGETDKGKALHNAGTAKLRAAAQVAKTIEKPQEAEAWKRAIALNEASANYYAQAAEAHDAGQTDKGKALYNAGASKLRAAAQVAKTIEKPQEAEAWKRAIALNEASANYYAQVVEAYDAGETDKRKAFYWAGEAKLLAAAQVAKIIEKPQEAEAWKRAIALNEASANYYAQAVEAYDAGETDKRKAFYWAGAAKLRAAAQVAKIIEKPQEAEAWERGIALNEASANYYAQAVEAYDAGETDKRKAFYWAGEAKLLAAAQVAKIIEKPQEAEAWKRAIALNEASANYNAQAVEAYDAGQTDKGKAFYWAGTAKLRAAAQVAKIIEKPQEAEAWERGIALNEASANYYAQAVEAYDAGETDKRKAFYWAGEAKLRAALQVAKTIEKPEQAEAWKRAIALNEASANYYAQAAEAHDAGETDKGNGFYWAGAAKLRVAAQVAKTIEKPQEAEARKRAIALNEASFNYNAQAAEAYDAGETDKGNGFYWAGAAKLRVAEQVAKTIEKPEQAEAWKRAIALNEASAGLFIQAVEAYDADQTDKGKALHYAGAAKLSAALQVAKTIEKPEQAEAWKRAIALNEASANYYTQAAEAHNAGQTDKGNGFYWAGAAKLRAAEEIAKTIEIR